MKSEKFKTIRVWGVSGVTVLLLAISLAGIQTARAADAAATLSALRIAGAVTDGTLPTNSTEFLQMADACQAGNHLQAATIAANSRYFPATLARRLARQMMVPTLDMMAAKENDATTFIVSHFVGYANGANQRVAPSISKLWSDDVTCFIRVAGVNTHFMSVTAAQMLAVNWNTDLVCTPGQQAVDAGVAPTTANPKPLITIPTKHVGGYVTLSDRRDDGSFALYGATAGTNLRMIEGIWQVSMGLSLTDMASVVGISVSNVPKFIPSRDPNFVQGNNQLACISCHAGGAASTNHGYATVADVFNYTNDNGFTYISTITNNNQRKSLGSNANARNNTNTCTDPAVVCNPDSSSAMYANQAWDVNATWGATGLLNRMGWSPNAPTSGQGLNALGAAIGKASMPYNFLTNRVITEICPLGTFSAAQISSIASEGMASDDMRRIVARVASAATCH